MTESGTASPLLWAPPACTLPTVEQPSRQDEFDDLFTEAVIAIDRTGPTTVRLGLRPEPRVAGRVGELTMRESACCSFFTFTLSVAESALTLEISVPDHQVPVLDALIDRAAVVSSAGPA